VNKQAGKKIFHFFSNLSFFQEEWKELKLFKAEIFPKTT